MPSILIVIGHLRLCHTDKFCQRFCVHNQSSVFLLKTSPKGLRDIVKSLLQGEKSRTMYPVKVREKTPVQPAPSAVYRHDIQLSDLNIEKDFVLCEGSKNECRHVFENYTKIISKEYGLPGATLHGDLDNPMDKGSITSGWILGNDYEIILSFKHASQYWKAREKSQRRPYQC